MESTLEEQAKMRSFAEELGKSYPRDQASLIPLLQKTQEAFGYLPREILEKVHLF